MATTTDAQLGKFADLLKILSHPTRLRIVALLAEKKELRVTQVYEQLNLPQAVASQYLIDLKNRGAVQSRKEGVCIFYSLTKLPHLQAILATAKLVA